MAERDDDTRARGLHGRRHCRIRGVCPRVAIAVHVVLLLCAVVCAAEDAMGAAVEAERRAGVVTHKPALDAKTRGQKHKEVLRKEEDRVVTTTAVPAKVANTKAEDAEDEEGDMKVVQTERPVRGMELSPEQLEAIGVTKDPPRSVTPEKEKSEEEDAATETKEDDAQTRKDVPHDLGDLEGGDEQDDAIAQAAANVSIDHVEAHLQILQQLELSVAQSIEEMNEKVDSRYSKQRSGETFRLSQELLVLQKLIVETLFVLNQNNLKKLAEGLNGTLFELEVVEKDSEKKSKKLKEVLEQKKEEEQEQFIEENGMKVVDYETGHIRNTTGLSSVQLKKLEAAEKKADPAVLHYDFELLGQIAILLGVSAIGGIIATYFNIPPNVGYLLGGALVGPSCLGLVHQYKEVETISLFGSIFLLFGHGAGYTPQKLDDAFKKYFIGGIAYITSIVILVAIVSVYIGWSSSSGEGLIIGVGVCFTTTAPLYEYIRANQIQESSYGRTVIAIIAVQDILMSFALGTPEWFSSRSVGWIGLAAVRAIISYGIVVLMAYALHLYVVPRLLHFLVMMEEVHHSPLVLLGVVSVCFFMALCTEYIGLSLECGAFLAGLAFVNASSDAKAAFTSIRVIENLFGSMFFACVGMILNPIFLIKNAGEILSMVILIILIKTCSMTAVMTFFDVSMEKALLAAVGLCQIGELALIFMIKAHATNLVSRRIYLLFVAAIAVFLGCSSVFNRQVLLARRKSIFRLPLIMRRPDSDIMDSNKSGRTRSASDSDQLHMASFSSPTTPRRKSTKVFVQ